MFSQVSCIERYLAISGKARRRGTDARSGRHPAEERSAGPLRPGAALAGRQLRLRDRQQAGRGHRDGRGDHLSLDAPHAGRRVGRDLPGRVLGRAFAQILPSDRRRPGKPGGADAGLAQLRRGRPIHPRGGVTHMTRQEFIARLKAGLAGLPLQAQGDIVADYETHFSEGADAGRSEADIAAALGDPERLARELRAEAGLKRWETQRNPESAAAAVFAVLGLGAVDVLVLLPILIGIVSVLFAFFFLAVAGFFAGAVIFASSPFSHHVGAPWAGVLFGLG